MSEERAYYWTREGKRGEGFRPVAARKGKRMMGTGTAATIEFEGTKLTFTEDQIDTFAAIGLSGRRIANDLNAAIMPHIMKAITHVGATLGKAKISASVEFGWDETKNEFYYSPPVPTVTLAEPKKKELARITTESGTTQLFLPGVE